MKTLIELIYSLKEREEKASELAGKQSPDSYNTAWLAGEANTLRLVIAELEALRKEHQGALK